MKQIALIVGVLLGAFVVTVGANSPMNYADGGSCPTQTGTPCAPLPGFDRAQSGSDGYNISKGCAVEYQTIKGKKVLVYCGVDSFQSNPPNE